MRSYAGWWDQLPSDAKNAWDDWVTQADLETREIVQSWLDALANGESLPRRKLRPVVWSNLKSIVQTRIFQGRCAYCERRFGGSLVTMDHFRPVKGTLKENSDHPGYFWLAYHWKNLIPCCSRCNSIEKVGNFPIYGPRYFPNPERDLPAPEQLDEIERPAILSPVGEIDPRDHIEFDSCGFANPKRASKVGESTIKFFGLNEQPFIVEERRDRLRRVMGEVETFLRQAEEDGPPDISSEAARERYLTTVSKFIERTRRGRDPFPSAVEDYVTRHFVRPVLVANV